MIPLRRTAVANHIPCPVALYQQPAWVSHQCSRLYRMASALDLIVVVLQPCVFTAPARTHPRTAPSNNPHRAQRKTTRSFIQSGFNEVRIRARGRSRPRTSQKPHDSNCVLAKEAGAHGEAAVSRADSSQIAS
jgi:hypothetical protein